jgi:hypothetical protein
MVATKVTLFKVLAKALQERKRSLTKAREANAANENP